jgi:hypothetical protein
MLFSRANRTGRFGLETAVCKKLKGDSNSKILKMLFSRANRTGRFGLETTVYKKLKGDSNSRVLKMLFLCALPCK